MDKPILDLAGAVADLTPIDWNALELDATEPAHRAALRRLRVLDRIVRACGAVAHGPSSSPKAAEIETQPAAWGQFTLHERVGHGTFGSVYRAHDRRLDRIVALKLLRPDRASAATVESEAIHEGRLLAKVRHPNVVTVYGAERIDGRVGVWMEFIDGRTLEDEVREDGRLAPDAVIEIGLTLCGALAAVHDAGLLHRDLKAQNVMRARDGRIILTDFGAGRAVEEEPADGRPELAGTPLYLAPEVLAGNPASVASEVYSMGVLLYHLATGSFPVRGRTLRELKNAHADGSRVSIRAYRDRLPRPLIGIIERAASPDVTQRFASLETLGTELARLKHRKFVLPGALTAATVVAGLAILALNLYWSRTPPLDVIETKVVRRDPGSGVRLRFVKNGLLYYTSGNTLYSSPPDPDAPAEIRLDEAGVFRPVDIHPMRDEFLAEKMDTNPSGEDRELWAVGFNGQNRPIGDILAQYATWSEDGMRIAYVSAGNLFVADRDGSNARKLPTPGPGKVVSPRWAPSNDRLRFHVSDADRFVVTDSLWEVRTDGTGLHELLPRWNEPPAEAYGRFSPDGNFFVFRSRAEKYDLWAIRERRGLLDWTSRRPVQLTTGAIDFEFGGIVDADNRTIYATGSRAEGQLVRYDLQRHVFEPYLGGISATWVAMSPDRSEFVYVSYPDQRLWRSSTDGSNNRRILDSPAQVDGAMWSPDGKWISYTSRRDGVHMKIFLLRADGTASASPITANDDEQGFPSWSVDSRQFVFGDVPRRFGAPTGNEVLHVYDLDTKVSTDLPGSRGLWTARWSPDGNTIAAVKITLPRNLLLFDVQRQSWRALPAAVHVNNPTWSSDGKFIYYDTEGGPRTLCRVRVLDGNVEVLRSLADYPTATYGWSGLTADDSPLVLRNIGTTQIYALTLGRR
jgi:serine/threonine-protein kinase